MSPDLRDFCLVTIAAWCFHQLVGSVVRLIWRERSSDRDGWRHDGKGNVVSPGGRVLSEAEYRRLST